MISVPDGSIYFWCYTQGLKHVPFDSVAAAVRMAGKDMRPKDIQNYWNGWYRSDLYMGDGSVWEVASSSERRKRGLLSYCEYPSMPIEYLACNTVGPANRWIPCNGDNKPLIKWGNGCLTLADAEAYPHQVYLAENNRGCKRVIIDCDGDHDDGILDLETIAFLSSYIPRTHTLQKDVRVNDVEGYEGYPINAPVSFHLSFMVDRVIPTMHFPKAHIDIIGNQVNSLRYLKTKSWNGMVPMRMTAKIWNEITDYIRMRNERSV